MNLKKNFLKTLPIMVLAVFLTLGLSLPVLAQDTVTPNGPFISDTQNVELEAFTDHEEMVKELKRIEAHSNGVVRLELIGYSYEGRELYLVRAGLGEDNVMLISQQHGNEPHGTEAVLKLINDIAFSGNPWIKAIRENLTVNIIPKLNPDGASLWIRYVLDPTAPNARTYAQETGFVDPDTGVTPRNLSNETYGMYSSAGVGWDSNRFHFVDWTTSPMYYYWPDVWPTNPALEANICAQTVKMLVDEGNAPLWFADLHNQGSTIDENNDLIMFALDTAHFTNDWDTDYSFPEVQQAARMLVAIKDAIKSPNTAISRYAAPSAYRGRSRNQYMQVYGIPGILIEMRGMGQKQSGKITQLCYDTLIPILLGTVDGSIDEIDWQRVFEITDDTHGYNRDIPANPNDEE